MNRQTQSHPRRADRRRRWSAVGLLAIPGSPIQQKPTLGLDLQGGLEVDAAGGAAEPDRPLEQSDLDRSVEIMRDRVDRLGVAEPEIRTQGDDQIVIELPGVKNPEQVSRSSARPRSSSSTTSRRTSSRPSIGAQRFPIAKESLYALLAGQQALVKEGATTSWYLFDDKRKRAPGRSTAKDKLLQSDVVEQAARRVSCRRAGASSACRRRQSCSGAASGKSSVRASNVEPTRKSDSYYLIRHDRSETAIDGQGRAGDDGRGPQARRHAPGLRHATGEPIVTMQFTDAGADKFGEITRREAQRGKLLSSTLGGGQKITQHFAIVLDREIRSWPSIDWEQYPNGISGTDGAQITGIGALRRRRTWRSCSRPARCRSSSPPSSRHADLGDARRGLARAGLQAAAIAASSLVAIFLLVVYRFLGVVAVFGLAIYAALLVRRDPALRRHADAAGLRRPDPHDRRRRRREHRHLRTDQGGGARGQVRARRDRGRLREGLRDDHRRERRHRHHGDGAVRRRDCRRARLRADAAARHRRSRSSRPSLATRAMLGLLAGFKWFDNPRFMGASAREIPKWQRIDVVGRRRIWFSISACRRSRSRSARIVLKGLNLGIDFKGGAQVTFTTPAAGRARRRARARRPTIGQEDAVIQGRGDEAGERRLHASSRSAPRRSTPAEQTRLTQRASSASSTPTARASETSRRASAADPARARSSRSSSRSC